MDILTVTLIYFGAMLIPVAYLAATRCHGRHTRAMIIGLVLQIFWSVCVYLLVRYSRVSGYTEWYYANLFYVPVNAVGFIYYAIVLVWKSERQVSL
jgi:uncharacterized membrane protein YhdT